MQIRSASAGHSDPAALAKPGETIEPGGSPRAKAGQQITPSATGAATAMAEILSRYDVMDISPEEFSQMVQKLFESGTISEQEMQQLAAIRLDLDLDGLKPDESTDLLEFYARRIKKAQGRLSDSDGEAAGGKQLAPLLSRLDWLEKFALIQSAPEAIGLDAVA